MSRLPIRFRFAHRSAHYDKTTKLYLMNEHIKQFTNEIKL